MPFKNKLSDAERQEIIELCRTETRVEDIAEKFNVHPETIRKHKRRYLIEKQEREGLAERPDPSTEFYVPVPGATKKAHIQIDFEVIERLAAIHCTPIEILNYLNAKIGRKVITQDALRRRIHEHYGMSIEDFVTESHKAIAKPSLRRMQWRAAEKGNVTMMIWLGKQYLDQTDRQNFTGDMGISVKVDWE